MDGPNLQVSFHLRKKTWPHFISSSPPCATEYPLPNANPAVLPGRKHVGKGVGCCGGVGGKVQGAQQITGTQCTVLEFGDTKNPTSGSDQKGSFHILKTMIF